MSLLIQSFVAFFRSPLTTLFLGVQILALGLLLWLIRAGRLRVPHILAISVVWWAALSFWFIPQGFNYSIYRYNATLTLAGKPAFARPVASDSDVQPEPYTQPLYLDYTGAQHLLYVLMTALSYGSTHLRLMGIGFQVWSFVTGGVLLWLLVLYGRSKTGQNDVLVAVPLVVLVFHPIFSLHWLIYSWEDKVIFALIPLAMVVCIRQRWLTAAALSVGCILSLNGFVVFWLPACVWYLYLHYGFKRQFFQLILWIGLGAALCLVPFFPDSLSGWVYRAARMSAPTPFWFSIYLLLPPGFYHPLLDKAIVGTLALGSTWLYWRRRVSLTDMLVVAISLTVMFGPYNGVSRVLPVLFAIMVLTPQVSFHDWIWFCGVISLYFFVSLGFTPANIQTIHVAVFYAPVVWVMGMYFFKRRQGNRAEVTLSF